MEVGAPTLSILKLREATLGRTIDLGKSVLLPKAFKNVLSKTGETSLLLVCDPNTNIVRMFPVNASRIMKFSLHLRELAITFLEELNTTLRKNHVKKLYSCGICIKGRTCFYEGYITKPQYVSLDEFKGELKNINGVVNVSIESVT